GTRRASEHGKRITRTLAAGLAERGITVISGLAEGIDAAAHQGALDAGGRTIAVLASGLDKPSPAPNVPLLERIAQSGCALSPFPMGVRALRGNFPQRNRIISGLSLGVVVVEAPPGSGALITAHFAAEQGREVFAVPGPAGFANSRGPHELIRDGAKLVESVEDIVVELNVPAAARQPAPQPETRAAFSGATQQDTLDLSSPPAPARTASATSAAAQTDKPKLSAMEEDILSVLHEAGSFVDEIALACRISISEALSSLTMLELKGAVEQLSGKRFRPK
ncbi:MAG TPA: DNA-protecting protein DprA, partial [Candidatus Hydrogenedentes bacterium]|nr:DNA-protecting protein DprA [Candidatus Hydrogenedentota bacterium]